MLSFNPDSTPSCLVPAFASSTPTNSKSPRPEIALFQSTFGDGLRPEVGVGRPASTMTASSTKSISSDNSAVMFDEGPDFLIAIRKFTKRQAQLGMVLGVALPGTAIAGTSLGETVGLATMLGIFAVFQFTNEKLVGDSDFNRNDSTKILARFFTFPALALATSAAASFGAGITEFIGGVLGKPSGMEGGGVLMAGGLITAVLGYGGLAYLRKLALK